MEWTSRHIVITRTRIGLITFPTTNYADKRPIRFSRVDMSFSEASGCFPGFLIPAFLDQMYFMEARTGRLDFSRGLLPSPVLFALGYLRWRVGETS